MVILDPPQRTNPGLLVPIRQPLSQKKQKPGIDAMKRSYGSKRIRQIGTE